MSESLSIKIKIEDAFWLGASLCCGWRVVNALINLVAAILENLFG